MSANQKFVSALMMIVIMLTAFATARSQPAGLEPVQNLTDTHQYSAALESIEEYLNDFPDDPAALNLLSDIYAGLGDWDHAVESLEKAVSKSDSDVDLLLSLAVVYREKMMRSGMLGKMSNAKKSRKALEKAFALDPNHLKIRRQMVFYLVHAPGFAGGDKDRGKQIARETIVLDESEGRIQLAVAYRQSGELDQAVSEFWRSIELSPDRSETYFMLGHTLIEKEDFLAAEDVFRIQAELFPDDPLPFDGLGDYYEDQKEAAKAIEYYRIALEKDRWFGDSRYKLARLYKSQKQKDLAAAQYEKLIELNPGYVDIGNAKKSLRKIKKGR